MYSIAMNGRPSCSSTSKMVTMFGMAERAGRLRLAREALARVGRIELLTNELDRDEPADLRILREIERSHAALPQAADDLVAADRGRKVRHSR